MFGKPRSFETQRAQRSTKATRDEHERRFRDYLDAGGLLNADGSFNREELWRLINCDEMPQPVDSGSAMKSKKAFARHGSKQKAQQQRQSENITVMPLISADPTLGDFLYQFLFKSAALWRVQVLMANIHTCLHGSQVTGFLGIDPPTVEEHLYSTNHDFMVEV